MSVHACVCLITKPKLLKEAQGRIPLMWSEQDHITKLWFEGDWEKEQYRKNGITTVG